MGISGGIQKNSLNCGGIPKRGSPEACNFIPVNFKKFLRTPFYIEYLWWLLLAEVGHCPEND